MKKMRTTVPQVGLISVALILLACTQIPPGHNPVGNRTQIGMRMTPHVSVHKGTQQEITIGVEWPSNPPYHVQAIPDETKAVTFFIMQNGAVLTSATIAKDPSIPYPTKSIKLYPGEYMLIARAYDTYTPVSSSPVLASGASSFTVVSGQDLTVEVTLTVNSSPLPGSPLPTVTPTAQISSTSPPTTPPPSNQGGTGIDLTITKSSPIESGIDLTIASFDKDTSDNETGIDLTIN